MTEQQSQHSESAIKAAKWAADQNPTPDPLIPIIRECLQLSALKACDAAARTSMTVKLSIRFGEESRVLHLRGREAWAMQKLVEAGESGCTPINAPGPRWSHYVYKLRGYGLPVETIQETHGGPFPGRHARYVLRTPVEVIKQGDAV